MSRRTSVGVAELASRPQILYRFYDRSDVLLYVGITVNLEQRMQKHAAEKGWWPRVDRSSTQIEYFDSRRAALDAEREAIKNEKPLYNDQHNEWVDDLDQRTAADLVLGAIVGVLGVEEVRIAGSLSFSDDQAELSEGLRRYDQRVGLPLASSLHLVETLASDVLRFRRVAQMLVEAVPPELRSKAEDEADHDHFCAGEPDAPWEERIFSVLRHLSYNMAEQFGRETPKARKLRSVA